MPQSSNIINESSTIGEKLGFGFQTLLLGMVTIFAILFIIYISIIILGKIMSASKKCSEKSKQNKKKKATDIPAPVAAPAPAPVKESAPAPVSTTQNDEELVAVIAAAIASYTGEPVSKFRVVSFKHIK
ncbi:MAG: OadG family transporter subunit [Eubacteriales bacterium]